MNIKRVPRRTVHIIKCNITTGEEVKGTIPVYEPLQALLGWLEEEVRGDACEEEGDPLIQLGVNLLRLDTPLQCHGGRAEECVLELREHRFDSQKLIESSTPYKKKSIEMERQKMEIRKKEQKTDSTVCTRM